MFLPCFFLVTIFVISFYHLFFLSCVSSFFLVLSGLVPLGFLARLAKGLGLTNGYTAPRLRTLRLGFRLGQVGVSPAFREAKGGLKAVRFWGAVSKSDFGFGGLSSFPC